MEKITIDKTIEIFEGIKKGICPWYPEPYYDKAINTMRKYQKIQEIIKVWHQDIDAKDFECIAEVAEVVEDGGSEES